MSNKEKNHQFLRDTSYHGNTVFCPMPVSDSQHPPDGRCRGEDGRGFYHRSVTLHTNTHSGPTLTSTVMVLAMEVLHFLPEHPPHHFGSAASEKGQHPGLGTLQKFV